MFVRNLVSRNRFLLKRNLSTTQNQIDLIDLIHKYYFKGFCITTTLFSPYFCYNQINRKSNKYKPYSSGFSGVMDGIILSLFWPISFLPVSLKIILNETEDLLENLDKKYEEKVRMEEEKLKMVEKK